MAINKIAILACGVGFIATIPKSLLGDRNGPIAETPPSKHSVGESRFL
jgi:hypothetical protein